MIAAKCGKWLMSLPPPDDSPDRERRR